MNETISYGTGKCGHAGQIFKTGLCAHCYIAWLEDVLDFYQIKSYKAERDCLTLALRLYGENDNTFSPETLEVMARWRPIAREALGFGGQARLGGEREARRIHDESKPD